MLLHLAREGSGQPLGTLPESLCQPGIAAALDVTQGALSSVLRRLEAGGAIRSEKAHVEGHDRRLKAYWLTPRGHEIVRRLLREYPTERGGPRRAVNAPVDTGGSPTPWREALGVPPAPDPAPPATGG